MNSVLCWDCNIIIILFAVQKCGPRKSAECAQWGKLRCCTTDFYAEITSCRQTSWHLKGYTWIVDGIAGSVTRISIPWWCKRRNGSLMEANRQRATKRKMKIVTQVSRKVMPLFFLYMKSFFGIRIDSCISVLYICKYVISAMYYLCNYLWIMCVYSKCTSKWFM